MAAASSTKVVMIAFACNLCITIGKFAAALFTGSSAMLSEAIHSLVDTSNQGFLLHGIERAARPPHAGHPLGYGMELYFWSFVVAIMLFSLGAGVSIYEGVDKLSQPHPVSNPEIAYVVLGVALCLACVSTWQALKALRKDRDGTSALATLRRSNDPARLTLLLEHLAGLAGLTVAIIGIVATHRFNAEWADGAASIAIGLILAAVAAFLSVEIKRLLMGALASADLQNGVRALRDAAGDVAAANERCNRTINGQYPDVQHLFLDVKASAPTALKTATVTPPLPSPSAHAKAAVAAGPENSAPAQAFEAAATPIKPTIAARPASARKGKGGKRRR